MQQNHRIKGFIFVIFGAFFWGIGGTVAQQLFQKFGIEVGWLVSTRLLVAGVLLLVIQAIFKDAGQVVHVWKVFPIRLVIYGIIGMLAVQYTYMASIAHGNAAVATLLQYLAPIMIIGWVVLRKHSTLTRIDVISIVLAVSGTFLLLTNGSLSSFAVSTPAVVWGILSAITLAFYTLYAVPLLKQFDSLVIVGWAMVIGSIGMSFIHPPWQVDVSTFTFETIIYLVIVIIFGTMIAFWFYIESLQTLTAKETSLLANIEPLTAVLATVLWLQTAFGMFQWIGTALIFVMMFILAYGKK
ncbi:MAG: EamA family transporter [Lysinibacillus sp.]